MLSSVSSPQSPEIVRLLQTALDLGNEAVRQDKANSLSALELYDLTILNIDEVLNRLPFERAEWARLMEIRTGYDDRLEYLRELYQINSSVRGGNEVGSEGEKDKTERRRALRRQSQVAFEELDISSILLESSSSFAIGSLTPPQSPKGKLSSSQISEAMEQPPQSLVELPYWNMRLIQRTIENGGFLTPTVYVPKTMWTQLGLKFSGLSAKTTAYQTIITILSQNLAHLPFPDCEFFYAGMDAPSSSRYTWDLGSTNDDSCNNTHSNSNTNGRISLSSDNFDSLLKRAQTCISNVIAALKVAHEDFINLQNQLSKPFPFIREVVVASPDETSVNTTSGATMLRLTSMVSNLGKNVRKYAEVGYQRLGALPTRVSDGDFAAFRNLIVELCTQCQILDKWYNYSKSMRGQLISLTSSSFTRSRSSSTNTLSNLQSTGSSHQLSSDLPPTANTTNTASTNTSSSPTTPNSFESAAHWALIDDLEKVLSQLHDIAIFMRDVVCEILLRDVESLLERYLSKTRKSFSRLHWDEFE